ncbi:hypothetical protein B005_1078 [Nocardiopsis alba ATCC BAA-2165]|uniref:Uncharacterized protein n=1 Tax=Nocardiopsis alba (strain ATCC BAA-2165 / BE74) TaxID=1205910 RepID=J7L5Z4_NOCAA|nr:hypothetical protein B005_1078 [Nocardiopsis alba ATCC BAA-2165]
MRPVRASGVSPAPGGAQGRPVGRTRQNSFPSGSRMTRNAPWASVTVSPAVVAPSASSRSAAGSWGVD